MTQNPVKFDESTKAEALLIYQDTHVGQKDAFYAAIEFLETAANRQIAAQIAEVPAFEVGKRYWTVGGLITSELQAWGNSEWPFIGKVDSVLNVYWQSSGKAAQDNTWKPDPSPYDLIPGAIEESATVAERGPVTSPVPADGEGPAPGLSDEAISLEMQRVFNASPWPLENCWREALAKARELLANKSDSYGQAYTDEIKAHVLTMDRAEKVEAALERVRTYIGNVYECASPGQQLLLGCLCDCAGFVITPAIPAQPLRVEISK